MAILEKIRQSAAKNLKKIAMSLLLSLEFFILQAPDVAIAQAGVGACLSTAIIIIAVKGTKRMEDE